MGCSVAVLEQLHCLAGRGVFWRVLLLQSAAAQTCGWVDVLIAYVAAFNVGTRAAFAVA